MDAIDGNKFVYTYDPAWHRKGFKIPPGTSITEAAIMCGLDYEVEARDLSFRGMVEQPFGVTSTSFKVPNRQVLVRTKDNEPYGIVSKNKYTIIQNMELFERVNQLLATGLLELDCMGAIYKGMVSWVLLKPTSLAQLEVQDGDPMTYYVLVTNEFTGSTSNKVGYVETRVVCANTMKVAFESSSSRLLGIRHSSEIVMNTEIAIESLDVLTRKFQTNVEDYRKLAKAVVNKDDLEQYVRVSLGIENSKSTRAENLTDRVMRLARGNTAWDAFNAVTEFTTHLRGSNDNRLGSVWFGSGAQINNKALELAKQMAA